LGLLKGDRVPAHLEDALGCLVVFKHLEQGRVYRSALVSKKNGNEYKVVYIDDEP
jgi:hypothetical protein